MRLSEGDRGGVGRQPWERVRRGAYRVQFCRVPLHRGVARIRQVFLKQRLRGAADLAVAHELGRASGCAFVAVSGPLSAHNSREQRGIGVRREQERRGGSSDVGPAGSLQRGRLRPSPRCADVWSASCLRPVVGGRGRRCVPEAAGVAEARRGSPRHCDARAARESAQAISYVPGRGRRCGQPSVLSGRRGRVARGRRWTGAEGSASPSP